MYAIISPRAAEVPYAFFSPGSLGAHVSVPSLVRHLENGCDWWYDWVELEREFNGNFGNLMGI